MKDCPDSENIPSNLTTCMEPETFYYLEEDTPANILYQDNSGKNTLSLEALGQAVIDTACTETCCGTGWMNDYIDNHLTSEEQQQITILINIPLTTALIFWSIIWFDLSFNIRVPKVPRGTFLGGPVW